jgi:hypothetical protein
MRWDSRVRWRQIPGGSLVIMHPFLHWSILYLPSSIEEMALLLCYKSLSIHPTCLCTEAGLGQPGLALSRQFPCIWDNWHIYPFVQYKSTEHLSVCQGPWYSWTRYSWTRYGLCPLGPSRKLLGLQKVKGWTRTKKKNKHFPDSWNSLYLKINA